MLLQLTIAGVIGWTVILLLLWITRDLEYEQVDLADLELWRILAESRPLGSNESAARSVEDLLLDDRSALVGTLLSDRELALNVLNYREPH